MTLCHAHPGCSVTDAAADAIYRLVALTIDWQRELPNATHEAGQAAFTDAARAVLAVEAKHGKDAGAHIDEYLTKVRQHAQDCGLLTPGAVCDGYRDAMTPC